MIDPRAVQEMCGTCRANRGEIVAPGGVIFDDGIWRLEHVLEPIPMAGWLVLKPLRHVESFAELNGEESESFGPLTQRIIAAMTAEMSPEKVYMCLFGEAENFAHIHVHLIPRFADTPEDRRGPNVFTYLSDAVHEQRNLAGPDAAASIAASLRHRLNE